MRQVVGAAIVRDGTVLACRRTSPPVAAGRWELPGGKVEPGETPAGALVREIREELGCDVEVTGWLAGAAPIGETHELRVACCRLVDGREPVPTEHDAVRWLEPERLGEVDWLEPDRPFLDELTEVLLDGARLDGGNVGGAVRVGATVRRPTGPWTPAVHALLAHVDGLPAVPRVLGTDARGREVLDFLPGEVVDVDRDLLSPARLASLGRWTRQFHERVAGFRHDGPWRFFGVDEPDLVAHNDLAPYNVCFDGEEVSGVFDWDLAGPSTAVHELAHLAWNAVPLFRPLDTGAAADRLGVLADAYGGPTAGEILAAVPARVRLAVDGIREAAACGDEGMGNLRRIGEPQRTARRLEDFLLRLPALEDRLRAGPPSPPRPR